MTTWVNGPISSLSGTTAFIGFPFVNDNAGTVLVFEQNEFGKWEQVEDPFIHDSSTHLYFGSGADIDGDLACILSGEDIYLYHRDGKQWLQIDHFIGKEGQQACSISGNIIALSRMNPELRLVIEIYEYKQDINKIVSYQEPILLDGRMRSMVLSNNYLVSFQFSSGASESFEWGLFVYQLDKSNQKISFQLKFDIANGNNKQAGFYAFDNDTLVFG